MPVTAYLFLDESGNFDFSTNGTKYLFLTSVRMQRQFPAVSGLAAYRYECLEARMDIEHFHCVSATWPVRNAVFDLIAADLDALHIDCLVVEKRKARPELWRDDSLRVYSWMLGYFMRRLVAEEKMAGTKKVIAMTDSPLTKRSARRLRNESRARQAESSFPASNIVYCTMHPVPISGCRWLTTVRGRFSGNGRKQNSMPTTESSRRSAANLTYSGTVRPTTTSAEPQPRSTDPPDYF